MLYKVINHILKQELAEIVLCENCDNLVFIV